MITIDRVRHEPFSEAQFNQFVQQLLNIVQRVTAGRRRPHAQRVSAFLWEEIPSDVWEDVKSRAEHDSEVHGRGAEPVHDVLLRVLRIYAHVGLKAIESLDDRPLPPAS